METVLYSLTSVLLRSGNSVFDRLSYGLRRQSILVLNFANNFVPFLLLAALTPLLPMTDRAGWALYGNARLALFAVSVQGVAFAFSYGFRHLTVARVNIASRVGDVLIPLALMLSGRAVHWTEYLFALAVSGCSLLAAGGGSDSRRALWLPAFFITVAVLVQSLCGELFFQGQPSGVASNLEVSTALMFWRSAACLVLLLLFGARGTLGAQLSELVVDGRARTNLLVRALFTVGNQVAFVMALAAGNRVVAWPILNSVTLFSLVFANAFIQEAPARREVFAVVAIVALAVLKAAL
ncbi:hypothetical protein [Myxococcus virescens]|uniref:EamA domain-containing protein n=1 Tax=Myxococcus virescens TaxID=83456 RepID=A0A511HIF8_9BACT|nr:hypothetical protein [Myxococcus virescens]GEL73357.1 hypothetical protein MVI01_51410 [Myxococcus virescens]SDF16696.1 hypothetical protein SAMN04488504_12227 [Myxococcus virescens]